MLLLPLVADTGPLLVPPLPFMLIFEADPCPVAFVVEVEDVDWELTRSDPRGAAVLLASPVGPPIGDEFSCSAAAGASRGGTEFGS